MQAGILYAQRSHMHRDWPASPSETRSKRFDNLSSPIRGLNRPQKTPIWAASRPLLPIGPGFASQNDLHETCTSFEPSTRDSSRNSLSLRSSFCLTKPTASFSAGARTQLCTTIVLLYHLVGLLRPEAIAFVEYRGPKCSYGHTPLPHRFQA